MKIWENHQVDGIKRMLQERISSHFQIGKKLCWEATGIHMHLKI